jgi:hypothetical protein
MLFVWRGIGIVVPIIFFICGWIVSYFYDDTRLGNPSFIGWTCFYTGIVLLFPGLINLAPADEGEVKRKHDFFFIPVIIWAVLLLIGSAVILFTRDSEPEENTVTETETVTEEKVVARTLNYMNSSDDTIEFVVADAEGLIERKYVEPHIWESMELFPGEYLFATFDPEGNTLQSFPHKKYAKDRQRYAVRKDKKGEFYLRIFNPVTESIYDYDEAWIMLDSQRTLMQIDVTPICGKTLSEDLIKSVDWLAQLDTVYDAQDMIEPSSGGTKNNSVTMVQPGSDIPTKVRKGERVLMLMSVPVERKITDEYIEGRMKSTYLSEE